VRLRDRLGVSERRQRQFVRAMQVALVGLLFIGLDRGDVRVIVNAGVALGVTLVPALLRRDYGVPLDAGLTMWIALAVFLHTIGTILPGLEGGLYDVLPWWDSLTHALSASVVAAVGYAAARAFDRHSTAVYLPPRFTFLFVLVFVMAFGVFWEVLEFAIGEAALLFDGPEILIQHGVEDTMTDLIFNTVGAVVVGTWGQLHRRIDRLVDDALTRASGGET
jgi:hypothetical protein